MSEREREREREVGGRLIINYQVQFSLKLQFFSSIFVLYRPRTENN